jgi:hypothetical protein
VAILDLPSLAHGSHQAHFASWRARFKRQAFVKYHFRQGCSARRFLSAARHCSIRLVAGRFPPFNPEEFFAMSKILMKASVTDLGEGKQSVSLSSIEGSTAQGSAGLTNTLQEGDDGFVNGKLYQVGFVEVDEPAAAAGTEASETKAE